jgi:hypothetical protein
MKCHLSFAHFSERRAAMLSLAVLLSLTPALFAQQPAGAGTSTTTLPNSPQPKQETTPAANTGPAATFIGYATNRSFIFPDIATGATPLTPGEKFKLFVNQSISPAYLLAAGISAGISQARDVPEAYGQGWDAYGGRYGASIARASSGSFFGTFVFASLLRQDPRFFPQSRPSFWGSVKYSAQRVVVTRTDSGRDVFNASGLLGPLASETLANVYLPQSEQTGAKTAERIGTDLAWKFAANMFKNYWPTLFHSMGLNHLKVIPDPGTPGGKPN